MSVGRVNKLINLLSHNKRNKIIFRPPPDNHRNNYVRYNRDAVAAQAPFINENKRKNVRQKFKTENAGIKTKPAHRQR
jgi:peptide subunit release factor 1 (eRF1)